MIESLPVLVSQSNTHIQFLNYLRRDEVEIKTRKRERNERSKARKCKYFSSFSIPVTHGKEVIFTVTSMKFSSVFPSFTVAG